MISIVRFLAVLIREGCPCSNIDLLLFCRSRAMQLYSEQEGQVMLSSLLQALVELLLSSEEQNRANNRSAFESRNPATFDLLPYQHTKSITADKPAFRYSKRLKVTDRDRSVYFEVTVLEADLNLEAGSVIRFGFAEDKFPLDDEMVGCFRNSYGLSACDGKLKQSIVTLMFGIGRILAAHYLQTTRLALGIVVQLTKYFILKMALC